MGLVFRVFNYTFTVAQLALVVHTRMVFLCLFLCIALKAWSCLSLYPMLIYFQQAIGLQPTRRVLLYKIFIIKQMFSPFYLQCVLYWFLIYPWLGTLELDWIPVVSTIFTLGYTRPISRTVFNVHSVAWFLYGLGTRPGLQFSLIDRKVWNYPAL